MKYIILGDGWEADKTNWVANELSNLEAKSVNHKKKIWKENHVLTIALKAPLWMVHAYSQMVYYTHICALSHQ